MMPGWSYIARPGHNPPLPGPEVKLDCFCGGRVSVLSVMGYITPGEHIMTWPETWNTEAECIITGGEGVRTPFLGSADQIFLQRQHRVNSGWHWVERNVWSVQCLIFSLGCRELYWVLCKYGINWSNATITSKSDNIVASKHCHKPCVHYLH